MSKPGLHAVALGTLIILVSGMALGQAAQATPARLDVFAEVQENLRDAADKVLAASMASKTWMMASGSARDSSGRASTSTDSVARLRAAVDRVNNLRPTVEPILREEGIPSELSAVVLVESGGVSTALSPKGALGVWQFMPDTARRYGLDVDAGHDERSDVVKSTRAAGRYLRDLYARFGDWSLSLAAYNAGESAVAKAVNKAKSRDFGSISGWGLLPLETRNYVSAVMAAMNRFQYPALGDLDGHPSKDKRVVYASSGAGE